MKSLFDIPLIIEGPNAYDPEPSQWPALAFDRAIEAGASPVTLNKIPLHYHGSPEQVAEYVTALYELGVDDNQMWALFVERNDIDPKDSLRGRQTGLSAWAENEDS